MTTAAVAGLSVALPLTALRVVQAGSCSGCDGALPADDLRARDVDGTILGLVCKSCSIRTALPSGVTPYHRLDALQRLRLRVPHHLAFSRRVSQAERSALAAHDWDHFMSPTHALWVHQGGRCPLPWHTRAARDWLADAIVLDHDHLTGLCRGLACQSCNVREGKVRRGPYLEPIVTYREYSPARDFPPTAGLSHSYLTRGGCP